MTISIILKEENIAQQIYSIRGEKVMLDFDLALLYKVPTKSSQKKLHLLLELTKYKKFSS